MESYIIKGVERLDGIAQIHGAKNSVLPILAGALCCKGRCEIRNCPRITDVDTAIAILRHVGCRVEQDGDTISIDASVVYRSDIPACLMREMRSSILFLGALLMRCGEAELVMPGGCALGQRPIDLHLWAMEQLGAQCAAEEDRIVCRAASKLRGCEMRFSGVSVGATENAILAALGAEGETVIHHAAMEPEITDLVRFLRVAGAEIRGDGTASIVVQGGRALTDCVFTVMPDRIETATYLCAAAGCSGDVFLRGGRREHLQPVISMLEDAGCTITDECDGLRLQVETRLKAPGNVITKPYPGFPTDAQAPMMAAVLRAKGTSGFTETVFENRLRHVPQLQKMGADVEIYGRRAIVRGVERLTGAQVRATDLRCGAALIVAALQAEGESHVFGVSHIQRGYDGVEENLRGLGAEIILR